MGKAQYKKKTAAKRHNPIRVPDAHLGSGKGTGQADPSKEQQVLPILQKMKSADYADRTWACAAVCNLVQNDAATRRLFQGRNVVGELIERLSDSVDEVVVEASGALRNLAIDGGHELCSEMFNKGIMPHLVVLMGKISSTIDSLSQPADDATADATLQARKHLLLLIENVVSLIWSLSEASHKTLQAVNSAACEGVLVRVLEQRTQLGAGPTLAAAQALYSLTQDNKPFRDALVALPSAIGVFVDLARTEADKGKGKGKGKEQDNEGDGRALLTRVLVCGVLRNIVDPAEPDLAALTSDIILPLVTSLLNVDLGDVTARVLQLAGQIPGETTVLGKDLKTDHRSDAETQLDKLERRLATVGIALEVLTVICAGLEDVEVDGEQMDEDDDVELPDEELIEMAREPDAEVPLPTPAQVNTLPHLASSLPAQLTSLTIPTSLSFSPIGSASAHPPTTAVLSTVHLRALEALNNLLLTAAASSTAVEVPGGWEAMFEVIKGAGQGADQASLVAKGQEMRLEVIEMALGCLWGMSKVTQTVTSDQVQTLVEITSVVQSDNARTRSYETLAAVASRPSVPIDENRAIGTWLVSQLTTTQLRASDLVAVLNAIIDIYADETREYDVVFSQEKFVEKLAGVVAKVRNEVRGVDRRKDLELRVRADEAYENLVAFIKYRRKLRR